MSETKPCPFCGSTDTVVRCEYRDDDPFAFFFGYHVVRVVCRRCGAQGPRVLMGATDVPREGDQYFDPVPWRKAARAWDERSCDG